MPCTMNAESSKSQSYNGWLIIDKPVGVTSAHIVARVKRLLGKNNKVGHAGTLDPLASGILPLAIGEATKVVQFLLNSSKVYEFEVTWGEERDTDDAAGKVTGIADCRFTTADLEEAMESFRGEIEQLPPVYSALKINGKRAYELARKGEEVALKPRKVTIHELTLQSTTGNRQAAIKMHCSKGTYVRSVARDLGRKLGCFGYVSRLHRSRHGQFSEDSAISLEELAQICEKGAVSSSILPLEEVLDGIPAFPLDDLGEQKIRNGIALEINNPGANFESETILLMKNKKLVAIAKHLNGKLQPVRVFNH